MGTKYYSPCVYVLWFSRRIQKRSEAKRALCAKDTHMAAEKNEKISLLITTTSDSTLLPDFIYPLPFPLVTQPETVFSYSNRSFSPTSLHLVFESSAIGPNYFLIRIFNANSVVNVCLPINKTGAFRGTTLSYVRNIFERDERKGQKVNEKVPL